MCKLKTVNITLAFILTVILTGCVTKGPYRCSLGMFHGKVYDVETSKPIEEAVIHITYAKHGSTSAGAMSVNVAVRETLTDAKGEYLIPEDTELHECYSGKTQGRLQIFKPGYGIPGHKGYTKTCPEEEKEKVAWANEPRCLTVEGKYLIWGLPKLKTREERLDNLDSVSLAIGIPHEQQMELLKAKNEERISVGLPPYSRFEKGNE